MSWIAYLHVFLFLFSASFLTSRTIAGEPLQVEWGQVLGTQHESYGTAVAFGPDDSVYLSGEERVWGREDCDCFAFVISYLSDGRPSWYRSIRDFDYASPYDIAVNNAGTTMVVGTANPDWSNHTPGDSFDGFSSEYSLYGGVSRTTRISTAASDRVYAVDSYPSGGWVLAGQTEGSFGSEPFPMNTQAFLQHRDDSGEAAWTRYFDSATNDSAFDATVLPSGVTVAAVHSWQSPLRPTREIVSNLLAYSEAGEQLWRTALDQQYEARSLDVATTTGGLFVAGTTPLDEDGAVAATPHGFVSQLSADGALLWTRRFGTGSGERVIDLASVPRRCSLIVLRDGHG